MSGDPHVDREASHPSDARGQVVTFRPRGARGRTEEPRAGPRDLEAWREPWEDYYGDECSEHPRRTLINLIGVGCTLLLIGAGLWLAHTLVEMRKIQDCVLSGRTNCAPIQVHTIGR